MHNLPGPRVSIAEVIEAIAAAAPGSAGSIAFDDVTLPFPEEVDSGSFDEIAPGFAEHAARATASRRRSTGSARSSSEGLVAAPDPDPKEVR